MDVDRDALCCAAIEWLRTQAPATVEQFHVFLQDEYSRILSQPGAKQVKVDPSTPPIGREQRQSFALARTCLDDLLLAGAPLRLTQPVIELGSSDEIHLLDFDWLDLPTIQAEADGGVLAQPSAISVPAAANEWVLGGLPASGLAWPYSEIQLVPWVDSTQQWAQLHAKENPFKEYFKPRAFLAEYQSQGRGRLQRPWLAPMGQCLMMTVSLIVPRKALDQRLSPALAMLLCEWLNCRYGLPAQVKWPNDLLFEGQKLAGFLVQTTSSLTTTVQDALPMPNAATRDVQSSDTVCVMMGLGLNLNLSAEAIGQIAQPALGLRNTGYKLPNKTRLATEVLWVFARLCEAIRLRDWGFLPEKWRQYDAYYGQPVRLVVGQSEVVEGVSRGVDALGQLLLQVDDDIQHYCVGEVSMRPPQRRN